MARSKLSEQECEQILGRATRTLFKTYTSMPLVLEEFNGLRAAIKRDDPGQFLLLLGESRVGKTTIVKQFLREERVRIQSETSREVELGDYGLRLADGEYGDERPIVYVGAPGDRSLVAFAGELLRAYGVPVPRAIRKHEILGQLRTQMMGQRTKILIIDDFQNAVPIKKRDDVIWELSELVKDLLERTRVKMILVGLPYAVLPLERNPQLDGRCRARLHIRAFPWRRPQPSKKEGVISINTYQAYLAQYEAAMGLPEQSHLSDPDRAERIHKATGGLIGRTTRLLVSALEIALNKGALHISDKHLEAAYLRTRLEDDKSNPLVDNLDEMASGYRAALVGKTSSNRTPIRLSSAASDDGEVIFSKAVGRS